MKTSTLLKLKAFVLTWLITGASFSAEVNQRCSTDADCKDMRCQHVTKNGFCVLDDPEYPNSTKSCSCVKF